MIKKNITFDAYYKFRLTTTNKWMYSRGFDVDFNEIFLAHDYHSYIIKHPMSSQKLISKILGRKML